MTTLFGSTAVITIATPRKKRSLLPLLTVLFVFSYGLMTMLIVEQGSVIQSQRNLIHSLMPDSSELWSMKGKAIAKAAQGHAQGRSPQAQDPAQNSASHAPSTQTPLTQTPLTQTPSTQAAPQQRAQSRDGKSTKPAMHAPPVPASDLADQRRALRTI